MTSRLRNNKYHNFTNCFSSGPLLIIQLSKIQRSPTGVVSREEVAFMCCKLTFQSVKADAL